MYYRYYYSHFETEPHFGVRTHSHKLIHFDRIDQWELYDLVKDPHEMNNVYNDPNYQNIVKELKKELKRLQAELGDDPRDTGENPRLKEYFKGLDKGDFKALAAALFRSWEMKTLSQSREKGVDVVALMDPEESESGRLKLQINSRTMEKDVRNLLNALDPEEDVGFILSLAGMSPEAKKLTQKAKVRLEILDINRFVGMWEESYPEMSKKDQALVPFDPFKVKVKRKDR